VCGLDTDRDAANATQRQETPMSRIVMSRITSHIVLLAAAVMAASAVALASPAFAHGGGGNSSHGMGRDMGPGPVIIGQTT
jgi:hypothetical protein